MKGTQNKTVYEYSSGKLVISGDKLELKQYYMPVNCSCRNYDIVKNKNSDNSKRIDNLARARMNVRQIVWCNVTPHSKFLTLTTADTCLEVKAFKRRLTTFIQAMKREGYILKYLGVLERQIERGLKEGNAGSVHCHLIVFNDEFIPFEIINKHWYGITDIHILNGLKFNNSEKIKDIGAYVCKYITKDSCSEWGSHCYFCSKGLKRPINIRQELFYDENGEYLASNTFNLEAINCIIGNSKPVFEKTINIPLNLGGTKEQYIIYQQFNKSEVFKNA